MRAVERQRRHQVVRREMRRERERQAELGGELRAESARAEQPDRDVQPGPGHRAHGLARLHRPEVAPAAPARRCGKFSASPARSRRSARAVRWSVPGARPRPRSMRPRIQRLQRAELLGDHQRRVVRQHDAARPDADASWCRRRRGRSPPRSRRWRCRACCGARRPRSACSPSARRAARGRACCGMPGPHRSPD